MKFILPAAIFSALALGGAAQAADPARPAPVQPASAVDWSGFYAGLNIGYGWGEITDGITPIDLDGVLGGVQAGYNVQDGGFVYGLEADYQIADISTALAAGGGGVARYALDHFGSLRARLGVDLGNGILPYLTGGVAVGHGAVELSSGGAVTNSDDNWHIGWTLGIGVEAMVTDTISIKAEYLHTRLGDVTYDMGAPFAPEDIRFTSNVVRTGLNFHF